MDQKAKMPKQRNAAAYALAVNRSGGGRHEKTTKAKRRQTKVDFKKHMGAHDE
jgi:hypothetical protein